MMLLLIAPVWNWNYLQPPAAASRLAFWSHQFGIETFLWCGQSLAEYPFNRTSLELKRSWCVSWTMLLMTFNRTSLELKPDSDRDSAVNSTLLIAPVWNWNLFTRSATQPTTPTFNRTSLELKRRFGCRGSDELRPFNRTSLELKPALDDKNGAPSPRLLIAPVWNWNCQMKIESYQPGCF